VRGPSAEFVPLVDGDPLPLETPPQGGHVSFVAALVRNVDPCNVKLSAKLRSPRSGAVQAEEARSVSFDFGLGGGDGGDAGAWGAADLSDIANAANIPACPVYGPETLVDEPFTLVVTITDRDGRSTSVTRSVVPSCLQTDPAERADCRCECSADYTLGRCAHPIEDGWLDAGGGGDARGE
jgi:hypothetical protein